ncbi:protein ENHANCED PSEUDOMONAS SUSCEPTIBILTY 1-like [Papaver somniferum]|uniref:protein ENHANCED PSEUDOMONAS SUSCEPTIBILTY 1-like n=1 Tax=Papaver somniferum TaxID=3469 RepID=UPI000E703BD8|nr:protein ENHANCED PSEUDOMONAS SUSCEPTIBILTY 1-like [Papaver somniferum]
MNINNTKAVLFEGLVEKCFHFTATSISKLKARANSEIISETKQNTVISSLQAVLAFLWIAVLRATSNLHTSFDEIKETMFAFAVNNKTKLIPPLPEAYSGNSITHVNVTATDDEVLKRGFGFLASLLNKVVNSINDGKIRSTFETMTKIPFIINDEAGTRKKVLMARSSHRFNMYGIDFGWGRPIAIKTGISGKSNGMTILNEGPVEGSIDIDISLPIEVFEAMENDAEFMEAFLY